MTRRPADGIEGRTTPQVGELDLDLEPDRDLFWLKFSGRAGGDQMQIRLNRRQVGLHELVELVRGALCVCVGGPSPT